MKKIVKGVFSFFVLLAAGAVWAVTVEKGVEITLEAATPEEGKAFHHWAGTGAPAGEAAFQSSWTYVPTASGEVEAVYGSLVTVTNGGDLATAVTTAGEYGVVRAGAGTYTISAQLSLGSVRLEGNGRDGDSASVLVPSKTGFRGILLNNKYAYVSGFQVNGFSSGGSDGGGIYIDANGGTVVDCRLTGNGSATAHKAGGGVYCKSANGLIARCIIDNNHADYGGLNSNNGGGGAYLSAGAMENCLLYGNYATRFGGGIQIAGEVTVRNCTIVGNKGRDSGGGVYVGNVSASVINCAILGNKSTSYTQSNGDSEWITTTLSWSNNLVNCASSLPIGETGLVADGEFADEANFNYTLLPGSALVNAGSDAGTALSLPLDLNGNPRVSGGTVDIGCCELDETAPSLGFRTEPREALVGAPVRFIPEGRGGLSIGSCAWTVTDADGATVASFTDGEPVQTFATPGRYTVSLSAGGATLTRPAALLVGALTNVVTTLTSAAIQEAVDAAVPGATVELGDGTYDIRQELEIMKPITLASQHGAAKCILKMAAGNDYKPYRILRLNDGDAKVEGITFTGAHCSGECGFGVLIGGNGGLLDHCVISNNVDSYFHLWGAGVAMWGDRAIVRNTLIENNRLSQSKNCFGGGIYLVRGTVENCLIKNNHAFQYGGGVYFKGSEGNVINCTFVGNKAYGTSISPNEGGGVYFDSKLGSGRVVNCAFYGNSCDLGSSTTSRDWYCANATAKDMFINCAFEYEAPNTTCFVPEKGNFKFVDVDSGNYRLSTLSELVDKGDDSYVNPAITKDFGGENDRILGDHVDIGCYEADVAAFVCAFDISPRAALEGSNIVFAAATAGAPDDAVWQWTVYRGDAAVAVPADDRSCVTNAFDVPGWYTVRLDVSFGGTDFPAVWTNVLHVGANTNYVVSTCGVDHRSVSPFNSWQTAATNIFEAVEEAVDGAVVMLGDGVYSLPQSLLINKKLRLTSLNGSFMTELQADQSKAKGDVNSMHRVVKIDHPDAVVERLTITKGRQTNDGVGGGGVLIAGNGGTLRDCIVERNGSMGQHTPGAGVSIQTSAGTIDRCIIRFNDSTAAGTVGGGGVNLIGGTIRNSLVYANRSRSGGGIYVRPGASAVIENCTVVSNICDAADSWDIKGGGGLAIAGACTVRNMVVWGNDDTKNALDSPFEKDIRIKSDISNSVTFVNCALPATDIAKSTDCVLTTDGMFHRFDPARGKFDFRLARDLDCVLRDRGLLLDWMDDSATDVYGNPRVLNRAPDIGACETEPSGLLFLVK